MPETMLTKKEYCRVCGIEIREEKDRDHYEAYCVG